MQTSWRTIKTGTKGLCILDSFSLSWGKSKSYIVTKSNIKWCHFCRTCLRKFALKCRYWLSLKETISLFIILILYKYHRTSSTIIIFSSHFGIVSCFRSKVKRIACKIIINCEFLIVELTRNFDLWKIFNWVIKCVNEVRTFHA